MNSPPELPPLLTLSLFGSELTQLCHELDRRNLTGLTRSGILSVQRGKSPAHWIAVVQTTPRPEFQLDLLPGKPYLG